MSISYAFNSSDVMEFYLTIFLIINICVVELISFEDMASACPLYVSIKTVLDGKSRISKIYLVRLLQISKHTLKPVV